MENQFDREALLIGAEAVKKLQASHVAIFGIGGVGSYIAEALARAGVGQLTLIDSDVVTLTNLNRQLIALHSTLGQAKTEVMAARIRDISPDCDVRSVPEAYTPETRERFFAERPDYIADAIDSVGCKLDLIETAITRGIPILSAMGTGNRLDPTQFVITDLAETSGDPLARVMRAGLRKRGIVHHTVLYSKAPPCKLLSSPEDGSRPVPGSVSWCPSVAGLMMAGYIVNALISQTDE